MPVDLWEAVLPDALHSIRSLLCTSTNATPHELFRFDRRSPNGKSLAAWLSRPGPVFLRNHVRSSKYDDVVEEVELLEANPMYANVRRKRRKRAKRFYVRLGAVPEWGEVGQCHRNKP